MLTPISSSAGSSITPAGEPAAARDADDVGQVELALGVVAADARRGGRAAWRAVDRHDAAVDSPIARSSGSRRRPRRCARACRRRRERAGHRRPGSSGRIAATSDRRIGVRRRSASRRDKVSVVSSGVSPNSTSRSSIPPCGVRRPARAASAGAHRVAGAERRILHDALRRRDETGRPPPSAARSRRRSPPAPAGRSAASRCAIIGRPAIWCMILGIADFIRVPLPAARMMAAKPDWLIDAARTQQLEHAAATVARPRQFCNTKIVAKYITTTHRLSRRSAAGSRPSRPRQPVVNGCSSTRRRTQTLRRWDSFCWSSISTARWSTALPDLRAALNEMLRERGRPPLSPAAGQAHDRRRRAGAGRPRPCGERRRPRRCGGRAAALSSSSTRPMRCG